MDFFSRYLAQIRTQLLGLTVSQKLLIGTLLVIMAVTVYGCVQYSAKPEMVALLPTSSTPEEIATMESYLKSAHYTYTLANDKILVPAEQAYAIRGELAAAQALPKDTTLAFAKLVDASTFMDTNLTQDRKWNYARQEVLTRIIRNFPYVSDATVIISLGQTMGLGRDMIPSSASVSVKLKHGDGLSSNQLLAIVDLIRGSVSGLKREDVHVTDGLRSYTAPSEDIPMPADLLAYKRLIEDDMDRKLQAQFSSIGDVKIAVNVVPEMSSRTEQTETYDPKAYVKVPKKETSQDTNSTEGTIPKGEPGVTTNVALALNPSSSSSHSNNTSSNTTTDNEIRISGKKTTATMPPGTDIKKMTASISVPRSYFVRILQRIKKDPKLDPEDKDLAETIKDTSARIQGQAMNAIGADTLEQIRVDWFDDIAIGNPNADSRTTAASSFASASPSISTLMTQFGKQAVLASFALVALVTMLMMVRRAAPNTAGSDADPSVFLGDYRGKNGKKSAKGSRRSNDPNALDIDEEILGEATQSEAVLTGIELDDITLQSRKMVDEVSIMVKENPENAAALVKRWLAKGK